MGSNTSDTIAAISTPIGEGGIGVVRVSGPGALSVADAVFAAPDGSRPSGYATHSVHYGRVRTPRTGETIDEAMLTVLRAPRSYTKEDIVEISCHGGIPTAREVLNACLKGGSRLAEPGEFTKRAFLNGRIDLAQAEAVLDLITSQTEASRKIALVQLGGLFSEEIKKLREAVLEALSGIELTIDFSQEDAAFPSPGEIEEKIAAAARSLKKILDTADKGMVMRHGASVVICGRPNVGKSSLMNALLRHDRVIVAPLAGTTRDVIEESIEISGVRVRLSDTAGMIETTDRVELEGIRRSKEKLGGADVVILMLDMSSALTAKDDEVYSAVKGKKAVAVANKSDLPPAWEIKEAEKRFNGIRVIKASALRRSGLDEIEDAIAELLFRGSAGAPEGPVVANMRHKELLEGAAACLQRALDASRKGSGLELLASDLNAAAHLLGLITGESVGEDILDRIFSRFCIGK